ncbi:MAG: hypothetical protein IJD69_01910 [Alphaproteobacteria bacterium]|nr:hypothetical protein [Alphaproteobacteria bacterium]
MEKIQKTMKTKRFKHIMFCALVLLLIGWAVFRFAAVASENARYVFNAARVAADTGAPIEVIEMSRKSGVLYEPLSVQNNRAYVSGARAANLRAGQRVGNGKIVSVSSGLDLDTGMYVVRTSGVADGLQYAEYSANGYFVPLYAIADNSVLVVSDGVATPRTIKIARQDAENAYIASGLDDGDIVILSTVNAGDKVQIKQ